MDPKVPEVTPYGIVKTIRYMVNSTAEFLEVIYTVNQILGTVADKPMLEQLHKMARFEVIPLPHSQHKFIACFDVPGELLGLPMPRKPHLLDLTDAKSAANRVRIVNKPPQVLMQYRVSSLYDINCAMYDFEATLAPAIPSTQWLRVKRSIAVLIMPRQTPEATHCILISAEANPAAPINQAAPASTAD